MNPKQRMAIAKQVSQRATPKCADERHAEGPHEIDAMPPGQKHAFGRPRNDRDHIDKFVHLSRRDERIARMAATPQAGRGPSHCKIAGITERRKTDPEFYPRRNCKKDRTDGLERSKLRIQGGSAIKKQQL